MNMSTETLIPKLGVITDVRQGLVDSDSKVADMLRKSHKPVVLAVNKVDNFDTIGIETIDFILFIKMLDLQGFSALWQLG